MYKTTIKQFTVVENIEGSKKSCKFLGVFQMALFSLKIVVSGF